MVALEELILARQEIRQLREVLAKDAELIRSLDSQVMELERLSKVQTRMVEAAERIIAIQEKALVTYERLLAKAEERANRAEDRAERLQRWAWLGPLMALVVGIFGGAFGLAAVK